MGDLRAWAMLAIGFALGLLWAVALLAHLTVLWWQERRWRRRIGEEWRLMRAANADLQARLIAMEVEQ